MSNALVRASFELAVTGSVVSDLVVVIFTPTRHVAGNSLFVGSNPFGQTGFTYLAAADCNIIDPVPTGDLNFPDMHLVMNVHGMGGCNGDGVCDEDETSCGCPEDCGDETCGNGVCCGGAGEDT